MTLEKYLRDREKWQDSTINHIRDRILFKSKNIIKPMESEKLVAIYGPPQIGKTTLILFLLGIDAEYQKEVYSTLRAGVPRGNSSTSTAIIYQRSENDYYGVKYGEDYSEIEYCSESQLKQRIQDIRKKVESEEASKDILHIYIPSKFFDRNSQNCWGINIVDLPGDGSRNIKEKAHVDAIINKYMTLATVNIITCKANEINSLGELELPINVDWRNLPHKYIIVITNAFGQGSVKKYFHTKKDDREFPFLEYVLNVYADNLKPILSPLSKIEVFPIDIGDSLERLSKASGLNEVDSSEVVSATYLMADRIRKSIQKRHGNSLKSTIMDLKAYSSEYAKQNSAELSEKIEELNNLINELKADIRKKRSIVEGSSQELMKMKDAYKDYISLKNISVLIDCTEPLQVIQSYIRGKSQNGRIKDGKRLVLSVLNEELHKYIKRCLEKYRISTSSKECIVDYEKESIAVYERINFDINLEAELVDKYYSGGMFSKKIKTNEILDSIEQLIELFQDRLDNIIKAEVKKQIKEKGIIEEDYQQYSQGKKESIRDIERHQNKIKKIQEQVAVLTEEYSTILLRKETDMMLINDYLQIAETEFNKYRDEIIQKLDSDKVSTEEKVYFLIYLCLLEKDYQSIVEMG